MAEKLTFEIVKHYFESVRGFVLLASEYVNSESPMRYICTCGNESTMSYKNAKKGRNCKGCGKAKLSKSKQIYTYEFIRSFFAENGCTLLAQSYNADPHEKLAYVCSCGSNASISWSNFHSGHRCASCRTLKVAQSRRKYTTEIVRALFAEQGKVLLETSEFRNSSTPLSYICSCGTESKINLNNFLRGRDCYVCRSLKISDALRDPNITDLERLVKRQYLEYKLWRSDVYERDNYTCRCCGTRGAKLNAHHIRNYADNPDLRTVLDNGITLCKECHGKFHSTYGKRNTDKAQLDEFLRDHTKVGAA